MKKKKWIVWIMAVALLFTAVPVHAETGKTGMGTGEDVLTEENRYDSIYFQEPEEAYPQYSAKTRQASQSFEEYMVAELKKLPDSVDVSAYRIPVENAGTPFFQVLNNHPELFFVNTSVRYSYSGGYIVRYSIAYRMPKEEIPALQEELEEEVDAAVAQIDGSLGDAEKALAVHDYLALHCEYDTDRLNNGTLPAVSHSAYGALVNRMAVCDGYAGAFAYIMKDRFGVPCITVSSSEMAHAWNMVYIGGQWYHVDVTWDDPTRDLAGRATHSYFLLSDSAISDSSHKHSGWSSDYKATSTAYGNAFWTGITSAIIHHQGAWYYSKYDGNARKVNLVRKNSLLSGSEAIVYAGDLWGTSSSFYPSSYMYLDQANGNIYFSTKNDLRRLNQDGTNEVVYRPSVPANHCIYGFTVRGSQLCYAVQSSPNLSARQNLQAYTLPELAEPVVPEITGISANDVHAVYDGNAKRITVTGTQAGDVVRYALEGGASYSASQPSMVNAGTYQVSYRVERAGYQPFTGKASVTIEQAVPAYTAPAGLKGSSGKTLASVALPEGFSWQTAAGTQLSREGEFTYLVKYVPSDTRNYKEVSGIQVQVTVTCPGHQYSSEVTKEPTATEAGIRTYTCALCKNTYTEEIEKVPLPVLTGIQANNVHAVYDGTAKTVTVTGTQAGDRISYASADGDFSSSQPNMAEAGTYQVRYRVERSGYQAFEGSAVVDIEQAVPAYTVPAGLKGSSGAALASVALPEGFSWQTAAGTQLAGEGSFTYLVKYVPSDTKNYKEVSDIQVEVAVSCPGHAYTMTVTKEPTATEKGERLYTCSICGSTYTEEMDPLDPSLPGIEGVFAEDIQKTYDGIAAEIELKGILEGDKVFYAGEGGVFGSAQPVMVNAGSYQVSYRVERSGYQAFTGKATVVIEKADPIYTVPSGLKGNCGEALGAIGLPEGFFWEEGDKRFSKEGTYACSVTYVPEDASNYKEVSGIPVQVAISCPGHQYELVIRQEPTTAQKGFQAYTCKICGDTYTEELAMLAPQKPGNVSGQKISKATVNSLKFTWKKAAGVRYELVLSQGSKKVSTKTATSNSVTFTKLKSGTSYTLKITPYRLEGGQKVYAAKSATLKAATAPSQVKLSSVKKSGSRKAKVTWKKVAGASGYEVYMRAGTGKYKRVKTLTSASKVSYTKSGLKKGVKYGFRIRAYKQVGSVKAYGSYSGTKTIKIR